MQLLLSPQPSLLEPPCRSRTGKETLSGARRANEELGKQPAETLSVVLLLVAL